MLQWAVLCFIMFNSFVIACIRHRIFRSQSSVACCANGGGIYGIIAACLPYNNVLLILLLVPPCFLACIEFCGRSTPPLPASLSHVLCLCRCCRPGILPIVEQDLDCSPCWLVSYRQCLVLGARDHGGEERREETR
jgi:hypothetical protein